MSFTGWPTEAFDVLQRLEGDPTMAEREAVRTDREQHVRVPMLALLGDLATRDPSYADYAVWRYAKGVRAWQQQSAMIRIDRNVEIGVGFDIDGLHVQGAWWYGGADQRERYRRSVAGRTGARLQRIVDQLAANGYEITGDRTVRVPRGFAPDHPRAQLLRHRALLAVRHHEPGPWLRTSAALDRLQETVTELRPLLEWLADHVSTGPDLP